jgi:hypothetical protein
VVALYSARLFKPADPIVADGQGAGKTVDHADRFPLSKPSEKTVEVSVT